jgi:hypothetical protein
MGKYVIAAASFCIAKSKFTHNFWCLKYESDGKEEVVAQLHGLATSSLTGKILPVGYLSEHQIKAHYFVYNEKFAIQNNYEQYYDPRSFKLSLDVDRNVYMEDDCLEKWNKAICATPYINELNLPYPRFGLMWPWGAIRYNSNSIYHTFADVMGLTFEALPNPWAAVGINNTIYPLIKDKLLAAKQIGFKNSSSMEKKAAIEISDQQPTEEKKELSGIGFFQREQQKTDNQSASVSVVPSKKNIS